MVKLHLLQNAFFFFNMYTRNICHQHMAINDYKPNLSLSLSQFITSPTNGPETTASGKPIGTCGLLGRNRRTETKRWQESSLLPACSLFAWSVFLKRFPLFEHGLLPPKRLYITSLDPVITLHLPFQLFDTWRWEAEAQTALRDCALTFSRTYECCGQWSVSVIYLYTTVCSFTIVEGSGWHLAKWIKLNNFQSVTWLFVPLCVKIHTKTCTSLTGFVFVSHCIHASGVKHDVCIFIQQISKLKMRRDINH